MATAKMMRIKASENEDDDDDDDDDDDGDGSFVSLFFTACIIVVIFLTCLFCFCVRFFTFSRCSISPIGSSL